MKKLTVATLAGLTMLAGISSANAAAGDSTVSIGYAQVHPKGLKSTVNDFKKDFSDYADDFNNDYSSPSTSLGASDKDAKGVNLKYRYEITDNLGVIGSFTYAKQSFGAHYSATDADTKDFENGKLSGKYKYYSLLVGPSYRFNDYFSGYAMVGAAFSRVHASDSFSSSYAGGSDVDNDYVNSSARKTQLAYSAGVQINPIKNIAIDVAYEGSGSGDWRTSGFNVGVGYSF